MAGLDNSGRLVAGSLTRSFPDSVAALRLDPTQAECGFCQTVLPEGLRAASLLRAAPRSKELICFATAEGAGVDHKFSVSDSAVGN
jgi:hypothetical protein